MFDSHCHPYIWTLNEEEIISSFRNNWWDYLISVWVDYETSIKSIELAKKYDFVYATIWIQPTDSIKYNDKDNIINKLEKLYLENKGCVVWIWECWLDYHWIPSLINEDLNEQSIIKKQKITFQSQIKLAKKYNLPLIIHNREAKDDTLDLLKKENYKNFIFHCYSENLIFANKCLKFAPEAMISFSWIVTFKNALDIQETVKNIPLWNILIETDSPYLTPMPFRGKCENKPEMVKYVLDKIIELRNEKPDTIKKQIFENSLKVFKIKC